MQAPDFEIQKRLHPDETSSLVDLLESEIEQRLIAQAGGYAKGRRSAWLGWKPEFAEKTAVEQPRGRAWDRLQQLVPGFETAECWRNGEDSSPGIHPHRDASYAARTAWLINLGCTRFRIWLQNESAADPALSLVKRNAKYSEYAIELSGGELVRFDCKLLHGSVSSEPRRWAVGLWTFNPVWIAEASRSRSGCMATGRSVAHATAAVLRSSESSRS